MIVILGVLANLCYITCGIFRHPIHAMIMGVIGNFLYIGYYSALGLHEPIINIAVGTICGLVLIHAKQVKTIALVSLLTALLITIIQFTQMVSVYSYLLIAASWLLAIGDIYKYNYFIYKIFVILSQGLWVIFCLQYNDYAMLATCAFIIATNLVSLIYFTNKEIRAGVPWRSRFTLEHCRIELINKT